MESIFAIGVGLALRIVVDVATDNDDRVSGVLVGLWEGVVLNHFVRRMPGSFDPYLGFAFRIFVDFLFTQSISRLALVALWALVGMLLADIAPNFWRDSGLRHVYRQVRKDVRHVKRAVPRIRIKNDLPSVRLFNQSRSTSVEVPSSIRSDIAAPSRSTVPSRAPTPTPGPSRRPGRSPPGTFPDVSGWSETGTDLSISRDPPITHPGPSPSLAPSRQRATFEHLDNTHVTTSQTRNTTVENTTVTITRTQHQSISVVVPPSPSSVAASKSAEPVHDPLRFDPPTIPDDWVDVNRPTPAPTNEPIIPPKSDPEPTPKLQPGPSTPIPSPPASIFPPPTIIDVSIEPPDMDVDNRASQLPDQIPLPESRAASVIGGVYDQPQPRSVIRDSLRSRVDKATSEIGVDSGKSLALPMTKQKTKSQSSLRSLTAGFFSRFKQDADAPEPPLKESSGEPVDQDKLDVGDAAPGAGSQLPTPAEVDSPTTILTQPGIQSPLLLARVDRTPKQEQSKISKADQPPPSAGVDATPPLQGGVDRGDTVGRRQDSLLGLPSPSRSPPPPFTEFAGVPEGDAPQATGTPAQGDPSMQDEAPTELTAEEKAAEEKRMTFLLAQVQELERSRVGLRSQLDAGDEDDATKSVTSDLEDTEKTLSDIKARMARKKFTEPPHNPPIQEITLAGKSITEIQFAVTSGVLNKLLARKDAAPITIRVLLGKPAKNPARKKATETKDAITAFARRYQFATQMDGHTGTLSITF